MLSSTEESRQTNPANFHQRRKAAKPIRQAFTNGGKAAKPFRQAFINGGKAAKPFRQVFIGNGKHKKLNNEPLIKL
jgi:hypothetical protein